MTTVLVITAITIAAITALVFLTMKFNRDIYIDKEFDELWFEHDDSKLPTLHKFA